MSDGKPQSMQAPSAARLMNRNFLLLWQGQFVSSLGSQAYSIAMLFWLKTISESASLLGLVMMLSSLPGLILGPIGGTVADRHSRKRIIVGADLFRGLTVTSLAILLFWMPERTYLIAACVVAVSVINPILGAFFRPAITASIPDLVPKGKVAAANSLNQSSAQISMLVGQSVGGLLFRILGAPFLFLFNGLSFLFSGLSECFISIPQKIPKREGSLKEQIGQFWRQTIEGFDYVRRRPGLRNLFLAAGALSFFLRPILVLFPFYVEDFLKVEADWYGYLLASFSAGALAGAVLAGSVRIKERARAFALVAGLLVFSFSMGGLGLTSAPLAAVALVFVAGASEGFLDVLVITILQTSTPSEIRGRVFGLLGTLSRGLAPIAMGAGGVIADLTGRNIPLIYVSCGAVMVLLTVYLTASRRFHAFVEEQAGA